MQLNLSDDEARTLYDLLQAYLPELRVEAARTDTSELRHLLVMRQDLCERLVRELEQAGMTPVDGTDLAQPTLLT